MSSFEPAGEATRGQAREASTVHPVPRWVAPSFVVLGLLTIPWIGYLMVTLPRSTTAVHYRGAWVGFDIGLVAALLCTGYQSWRGNARLAVAATAAATMLAVDAWFDVVTTPSGPDLYLSVALAAVVELPLAAVCLWIALHTEHLVERRIVHLARRATRAEARVVRAEAQVDQARARVAREQAARAEASRGPAVRARLLARHAHGRPVVGRSAARAREIVRRWRRVAGVDGHGTPGPSGEPGQPGPVEPGMPGGSDAPGVPGPRGAGGSDAVDGGAAPPGDHVGN